MSDHVPLARAAGPVSGTWETGAPRWWDAYFAVCWLVVAALVVLLDPPDGRLAVGAVLLLMAVWFVIVGRPMVLAEQAGRRGVVFQVGLLALFVVSMTVSGVTSFLLFALSPLVYMTLPMRYAHVAVGLYAFTPAVMAVVRGAGPVSLAMSLPLGAIVTTVSVIFAITTDRTERISADRAALIEELEATRAELARLSHEAGVAEERQRLAGDIHDTVAQGLSSVVMLVQAADASLDRDPAAARAHLALAARTARENLDETRAIVAALTPTPLASSTVAAALGRLADRFSGETGVPARLSIVGDTRPLPTRTEVVLLRVVQEALTNVRKHAAATTVVVTLTFGDSTVDVRVDDDGIGFDPAALAPGYGLGGMRARVEQAGGHLRIASTPGAGTMIATEVTA